MENVPNIIQIERGRSPRNVTMHRLRNEVLYALGISVEAYTDDSLPDGFTTARRYIANEHSVVGAYELYDSKSDSYLILFMEGAEPTSVVKNAPNVKYLVVPDSANGLPFSGLDDVLRRTGCSREYKDGEESGIGKKSR